MGFSSIFMAGGNTLSAELQKSTNFLELGISIIEFLLIQHSPQIEIGLEPALIPQGYQ